MDTSKKTTRFSQGKNHEDISNENRSFIIRYLRQNGVCSRAQISKAMGLTQASISKITSQLIEEKILNEVGYITGEKGRRSVGIALNTRCKKTLGVRISRRSFAVGIFDLSGQMYERTSGQFTAETTLHDVIARIRSILWDYLRRDPDIASIGVAVPGPFNYRTDEILLTTSMSTPDWTNTCLKDEFGDFTVPICFCHDAEAGALADWWFGSQSSGMGTTLVHFLVGEGVGAGCVANGKIVNDYRFYSREVGHISIDVNGPQCRCGNRGCLELYCSTFAFLAQVQEDLPNHPESSLFRMNQLTVRDVFTAAKIGDQFAGRCVDRLGTYVGYGVVNVINAYVPDVIIISNDMARAGGKLLERVREVVNQRVTEVIARHVSIQLEDDWLMEDPILYGAAAVAVDLCMEDPLMLLGAN